MAIPVRYAPRRAQIPYLWLLATAAAALIAIGPIAAAVFVTLGGGSVTRTAFATAPAGNYAVAVRSEGEADVIVVIPADQSAAEAKIARVSRLPGYTAYGAVSPDGLKVALVTADRGSQSHPLASLVVVDLETGDVSRIADGVDYLQTPVWAPDSAAIVVTRSAGDGPAANVDILRVSTGGDEQVVARADVVLGAYPVGFDSQGRLVHVVIDGRGSTAHRDGAEIASLSAGITRDWRLNADGSALAFIETSTASGVQYFARTVSLDSTGRAFSLTAPEEESLGVAWRPGQSDATFGREPGAPSAGARGLAAAGFDVPLAYSADGGVLAAQRWTGESFDQPGQVSLEIVNADGSRRSLEEVARFYGWATR